MSDSSTDKLKQAAELIRKRKAEQAAKGESPLKKAKVLHTGPYLLVKQVKNLCLLATNKPLPKQSGIKQITVKTEHQVKSEENKAGPIKPKSSYFFYKNAKKEHFKVIVRVTNRSSPLSPQKFTTKDGAPWVRLFDIQDGTGSMPCKFKGEKWDSEVQCPL